MNPISSSNSLRALITCERVGFAYDGVTAVQDASFTVNAGDYVLVAGENGSGKSTLLKGLLRLIRPVTGHIHFDESLRPNEIGYLPQQTAAQKDFPASAWEVTLSGRAGQRGLFPFYAAADRQVAATQMRHLDIYGLRNRCYRELSGGQQQRVLLARAFCSARKLLLLDEPAAGLDAKSAQEMYRRVAAANNDEHLTVIMVTHDIKTALPYASHVLQLGQGKFFFGTVAAYIKAGAGSALLGN